MIDGVVPGQARRLVLERADVVVWLDLPMRIWLPRLLRRTARRVVPREELWNGNRETLRDVAPPENSLILYALRHYRGRRRAYPAELASLPVVRLRSQAEVERFLRSAERET